MQPVKIPKTPSELFLKNKNYNNIQDNDANTDVIIVKHIDELYTKDFIDDYFKI
jgi:hypothetical protein